MGVHDLALIIKLYKNIKIEQNELASSGLKIDLTKIKIMVSKFWKIFKQVTKISPCGICGCIILVMHSVASVEDFGFAVYMRMIKE